ncbi:MAG: GNAT family N-acetyltransferase [Tenericutes bacterium HGW-Tenericutes-1]|jgi:RimJ/RimL family protein N-acetyltransferase|nr:MAG: GNAT family N-acetyltransferase [Tenericutes bacterium HGW-Tenericutes-1]
MALDNTHIIIIKETSFEDLDNTFTLWNSGEVMKFVGFPNGLGITHEKLQKWLKYIENKRPKTNHYSIYDEVIGYCGETFYSIYELGYASLDIKLLPVAQGRGIAYKALSYAIEEAFKQGAIKVWVDPNPNNIKAISLYERLGFVRSQMPKHLINQEDLDNIDFIPVYMEKS